MGQIKCLVIGLLGLFSIQVFAGDVEILSANFSQNSNQAWSIDVTLLHGDTGWDHYADAWRVVDEKKMILGTRTLYHPHVGEQPFTRSHSVKIPAIMTTVYIEAHDKVHGWSPQRLEIDLSQVKNGQLRVDR